jgi:Fe-S cluster assembly iron-binding protein IscA
MFSLTPAAAAAMTDARSEVGAPDEWGIRFFARTDGSSGITFDFVPAPEPDDVFGGSGKLRTYVEAGVHREIGDATVDYDDADATTELIIRPHRNVRRR